MKTYVTKPFTTLANLIVFSGVLTALTLSSTVPDQSFAIATRIQQQLCPLAYEPETSKCCGLCSMHYHCSNLGNCCLQFYEGFQQALYSSTGSISSCVTPEFITEENDIHRRPEYSRGVMMWSKCNEEMDAYAISYITIDLCENSRLAYDIDNLTPVDDPKFKQIFKNRFCATCNGPNSNTDLFPWSINMLCNKVIVFSNLDDDLLSVAEGADCNVFFSPTKTIELQYCHTPTYKVTECNTTGLWSEFNSTIEDACNSFTDPFNNTYRNYFCYLCNTNNPVPFEQWSCKANDSDHEEEQLFSYWLSSEILQQVKSQTSLQCDSETQFTDFKMMVCRDLKCDHLLYHENCLPRDEADVDACVIIFIKFTFGMKQILFDSDFKQSSILSDIKLSMKEYIVNGVETESILLFKKTSVHNRRTVVDYVVAAGFNIMKDSYKIMKEHITQLHNRACYVGNLTKPSTNTRVPLCEFATYNYSLLLMEPLRVPNRQDFSIDTIHPVQEARSEYHRNLCAGKESRVISKLDHCLHIDLSLSELPMRIKNSFLIIQGSSKEFVFSQWEYKKHVDIVSICLEDYLDVYKDIARKKSSDWHMSNQSSCYICRNEVWIFILMLSVNLVPVVQN